ncbi:hypothetical protein EHW66_00370 [Erwinia psidii]|uniref:hypothetical protein n=1 Tax=Erwinia psidii TaxID=69224 RepID=UPI00226B59E7|nr:hypothetical protein [Erwinia psidii]MCX8963519.1 hypothetical protein [Erwinia psidii]
MQIINHFRAKVLHSSSAAFSLAMKNNKYISFAEKIISVKNENMHRNLINNNDSLKKEVLAKSNIFKYELFLGKLSKIKQQSYQRTDILNYNNCLPRLTVVKVNGDDHEYFLPYNNEPKNIIITDTKESLI